MASDKSRELPVQLRVYDLPPSAVLAATLDPTARPRKHLVRVTVPTTPFLEPVEDPLTGSKPPDIPAWYTSLLQRGAVLRMVVKPLKSDDSETAVGAAMSKDSNGSVLAFATPTGKVTVRSGDSQLDIVHVNQTSAMLQKEQIGVEPLTQLKRVVPARPKSGRKSGGGEAMTSASEDVRLPAALRRPVAARKELLEVDQAAATTAGSDSKGAKASSGGTGNTSTSKSATGGGSSSTGSTTADKNAKQSGSLAPGSAAGSASGSVSGSAPPSRSTTPSAPTSTGAQIMSMFGSYPLSRLGTGSALASSLTSVSSVTARGSSVASSSSAKTNAEALAASDRAKHGNKAGDGKGDAAAAVGTRKPEAAAESASEVVAEVAANAGSTVAQLAKDGASAVGSLLDMRFRFSTMLAVAVVAFLLGSLIRSAYTPVDFVLVSTKQPPFTATVGRLTAKDGQGTMSAKKDFVELVDRVKQQEGLVRQVEWTQLRRLVQLPVGAVPGWSGWDVVLGGVRRR